MRGEVFSVAGTGRVWLAPWRGRGECLSDEARALVDAGADVLVSMLTESEDGELELRAEREVMTAAGIRFVALPTPDRGVPDTGSFRSLLDDLSEGRHVVIHCQLGLGRASLVAAGLLIREGHEPEDAWAIVRRARGLDVPDTSEQRAWLANTAAR